MELALHPLLSVRAGLNGGQITAGTGVRWRGVSLDYTFEQNEIEHLHRVGASIAIGPTIHERRRAALAAQERALQERFAAEFDERQTERIRKLLVQADRAESLGRHEEARERYRFALSVARVHDRILACKFLSRLSYAEGNRDKAIYWIKRGLEINPTDHSLVEMLRKLEGSQQ